jgi:hypothetical protein
MPEERTRVDEVPMYGGLDRTKFPELVEADKQFISGAMQEFGSREKASQALD